MAINLSPEQEQAIVSIAAKINGSKGGKTVTPKRLRHLKKASKIAAKAAHKRAA